MQENEAMENLFQSFNVNHFDYKYRLGTFIGNWKYDHIDGARCTSKKLAKAGFVCTVTEKEPDAARCFVCQHELLWDPEDDPLNEHGKHRPDCEFVKTNKNEDDYTVKDWIKLLAYANSVQMYSSVADTISNFETVMNRLVSNIEKVL